VQEVERSAPSVEEAVEAALEELGASEQEVVVEVVQEPRSGLLGIGAQEAVVRVRLKAASGAPTEEEVEEQSDLAAEFVEGLLQRMGIAATVETGLDHGTMYVDILGTGDEDSDDDMALLIGHHGATLESLQEVTRVVIGNRTGLRCRVMVDVEDYRKRQRSRLATRARDLAKKVAHSGREQELEPMNPYERKVVHDAVAEVSGATSFSRDEDAERHVVIAPEGR
jgi:spoIIIJ-associated protein